MEPDNPKDQRRQDQETNAERIRRRREEVRRFIRTYRLERATMRVGLEISIFYRSLRRSLAALRAAAIDGKPTKHAETTAFLLSQMSVRPRKAALEAAVIREWIQHRGPEGILGVYATSLSAAAVLNAHEFQLGMVVLSGLDGKSLKSTMPAPFVDLTPIARATQRLEGDARPDRFGSGALRVALVPEKLFAEMSSQFDAIRQPEQFGSLLRAGIGAERSPFPSMDLSGIQDGARGMVGGYPASYYGDFSETVTEFWTETVSWYREKAGEYEEHEETAGHVAGIAAGVVSLALVFAKVAESPPKGPVGKGTAVAAAGGAGYVVGTQINGAMESAWGRDEENNYTESKPAADGQEQPTEPNEGQNGEEGEDEQDDDAAVDMVITEEDIEEWERENADSKGTTEEADDEETYPNPMADPPPQIPRELIAVLARSMRNPGGYRPNDPLVSYPNPMSDDEAWMVFTEVTFDPWAGDPLVTYPNPNAEPLPSEQGELEEVPDYAIDPPDVEIDLPFVPEGVPGGNNPPRGPSL